MISEKMQNQFDMERLARLIKTKRAQKGLREAAAEIGNISPSTLSRVENGHIPDMETFVLLCDWLGVTPSEFFSTSKAVAENPAQSIEIQLRADKNLDPITANMIATLVRTAYQEWGVVKKADDGE